ncbi:trypsin-like serine peptidase [Streptomyces syringium]|uniref:trypsin-like serine peptidase n=1 Tax=Streptomyces syringium TaxID=76729 RepID=UPI0036E8D619
MRTSRLRRLAVSAACGTLLTVAGGTTATAATAPTPGTGPKATPGASPSATRAEPTPKPRTTTGTGTGTEAADTGDWSVEDALRFWTPQRITSATDPSGRAPKPATTATPKSAPKAAPRARGLAGAKPDTSEHFPGIKSVGMLFAVDKDMRAHYCSASAVASGTRSLMLTAGHCQNSKAVFVPQYDPTKSLQNQPYGIWPVEEWFADKSYGKNAKGPESDLDFAFARVKENDGKKLQDVVGGSTLARTPGFENTTTVIGYPSVGHNPQDLPVQCTTPTAALPGFNQMRIDCAGMWGGVSGGPWFSRIDRATGTGEIIGNVGGYNGGGPAVPSSDPMYNRISYSPMYGDRFFQLYDDAEHGRHSDPGPYRQPKLPFSLGGSEKWQQAKLTAAGDFTGSGRGDLIAVWADGSASLFEGAETKDAKHPFSAEVKLAGPGSVWQYARTISGGAFTGSGTDGLLVRWSDGELTEYTHVDRGGFHDEKKLADPNATWKNAKLITSGRYTANALRDDMLVVWANGSVTMYPDVDTNGIRKDTQLVGANSTWPNATQISAGEFTGKGTGDLLVRWSDGEGTIYPGVDAAGLHGEIKIRPAKSAWTKADVITVGSFSPGSRLNDILVRWNNGNLSMYTGVDAAGTHAEVQLVG